MRYIIFLLILGLSLPVFSADLDTQIQKEQVKTWWVSSLRENGSVKVSLRSYHEPHKSYYDKNSNVVFHQKKRPTKKQVQDALNDVNKTNVIEKKRYTKDEIDVLIQAKLKELGVIQ